MISRRQFLKDAAIALAGVTLGALTINASCKGDAKKTSNTKDPYDLSYLKYANPATADNSGLPVSPINKLFVFGETAPNVSLVDFKLRIYGLVDNPLEIAYKDFQKYDRLSRVALLICPDAGADNPEWSGVLLSTLLKVVVVKPEANGIDFHSVTGTIRHINLNDSHFGDVFIADKVDGVALPADNGFPLRLVQPHVKGAEWLKWLNGIELISRS